MDASIASWTLSKGCATEPSSSGSLSKGSPGTGSLGALSSTYQVLGMMISHSSGTPLKLMSSLAPEKTSQKSSTPFSLQSAIGWHSSGTWFASQSTLVPPCKSQESADPLALQSGSHWS